MMTARVSLSSQPTTTTTWGNGGNDSNSTRRPSIASAAAVDAYAQAVLESQSTEGHEPDDSLGAYVTSLIRLSCNNGSDDETNEGMVKKRARDLPDFESLVELVQEHCSINTEKAENVLERIARAVQTREIPPNIESDDSSASATTTHLLHVQQHHYSTEDLIQSMNLLSTATTATHTNDEMNDSKPPLTSTSTTTSAMTPTPESSSDAACPSSLLVPDDDTTTGTALIMPPPVTTLSATESASSIVSPVHADNLIPVDLLGVLDDPSTPKGVASGTAATTRTIALTAGGAPIPLPPVAAAAAAAASSCTTTTTTTKHTTTSTTSTKKKEKKDDEERQRLADDIAAALFQPTTSTRSRQSSIDETNKQIIGQQATTTASAASAASPNLSPNLHATTPGVPGVVVPEGNLYDAAGPSGGDPNSMYYQQQQQHEFHQQQHEWNTAMDILLSLNADLSEEAASAAAYLAGANVNVAQYLIDSAISAPPICRHLLNDGCYRSDCTYSHNIDGHSCLFWLRGRCGKGESCRFLHGFDEKLLNDIDFEEIEQQQHVNEAQMNYNLHHQGEQHHSYGYDLPPQHHHQIQDHSFYPTGTTATATSSWRSEAPGPQSSSSTTTTSFANIASQGYQTSASFAPTPACAAASAASNSTTAMSTSRKVDIPQDLWNAHENRDASVFYITDPIERYHAASSATARQQRDDVIDLHFQSTKTFGVVLQTILPPKLERYQHKNTDSSNTTPTTAGIWIVTGTGHHVGSKTHQKGGGALEQSVVEWLTDEGYEFYRGRDRNGQGGAVLVTRKL